MSTYPVKPRAAFVEWCQAHDTPFTTHAAAIGLSAAQAAAFQAATGEAAAKLLAQEQARQAYQVATRQAAAAVGDLLAHAGDAVRSIRAFAALAPEPQTVYSLAQVPPPATPTPLPPPGQPTNLRVALEPTSGSVTLRWQAANPAGASGTSYIIRRRVLSAAEGTRESRRAGTAGVGARSPDVHRDRTSGEFVFLGVSGKKTFVDDTLVAGAESVQYTVQGQRGQRSGPVSPIFTVNFGKKPDGGGKMVANVTASATDAAAWNIAIPAPKGRERAPARR